MIQGSNSSDVLRVITVTVLLPNDLCLPVVESVQHIVRDSVLFSIARKQGKHGSAKEGDALVNS